MLMVGLLIYVAGCAVMALVSAAFVLHELKEDMEE